MGESMPLQPNSLLSISVARSDMHLSPLPVSMVVYTLQKKTAGYSFLCIGAVKVHPGGRVKISGRMLGLNY